MKRKIVWSLLMLVVLVGASLKYTRSAYSSSSKQRMAALRAVPATSSLILPVATTFDVDRTDDTAAATVCSALPNDCSLRGAIIAANADPSVSPVTINLQPATTYNLTLANATQENAAATGDLDITTSFHSVTIVGGGSSGPNATIIDAAGLNTGSMRDRAFHITMPGANVTFQDLVIQNGRAADNGTFGASTNPTAQNTDRAGGGILNNGGRVTLTNVTVQSCQALGKGDTIVNNPNALDAMGGGLASLGIGNVIITGSPLTANTAQGDNGGNFNNGNGSGARGGSIYFEGGTLNISGSRILLSSAIGGIGGNGPGNQTNGGAGGASYGGGAYLAGTISINNSTFESCAAVGGNAGTGQNSGNFGGESGGGGIYSLGSLTVTNSTFDLDSSTGGRGGDAFGPDCFGAHIAFDGGAARGGAILAGNGSLIINTATFANNSANGGNGGDGGETNGGGCAGSQHGAGGLAHGGAITNLNAATVNIEHATISLNNAQAGNSGVNQGGANSPARLVAEGTGGGIRVAPGSSVTLENTIIAGNTAANGTGNTSGAPTAGPNVDGAVTSNGHNLLGNAAEATGFTGVGDQTGANPMLAPLADNGGPTWTMALSLSSPAVDAGVAAGATFDQRGLARTFNQTSVPDAATSDGTDIGAFELQPLCSLTCPGDVTVPNDPDTCAAVVTYTAPSGSECGTVTCDHPSGTSFAVGDTIVTCTSSVGPTCTFKVTVTDSQAPVLNGVPADATVECSDVPAAPVVTGSDNCDSSLTVQFTQTRADGSCPNNYTLTRTWTVTDNAGNTTSKSQIITVQDTTAPVLSAAPPDVTVECDSVPAAATLTATDNCDSNVTVQMTQTRVDGSCPSNYTLTRTWTATDSCGNHSSKTQVITVRDTTKPNFVTPPTNHSAFADANCQAPMPDFTAGVVTSDNCSTVSLSQSPAVGTPMPVGHNPVQVTATDACGNATSVTVFFDVIDNTPPVISCPSSITLETCDAMGAIVGFPTPTATDNCGVASVTTNPPSGSTFPIGATTVIATAFDAAGNSSTCSFTVTVLGARGTKQNVLDELKALRATVTNKEDREKLDSAILHLTASLNPQYWIDQSHVKPQYGDKVFDQEEEAVEALRDLLKYNAAEEGDKHDAHGEGEHSDNRHDRDRDDRNDRKDRDHRASSIPETIVRGLISRIVCADRILAQVAINDAVSHGGNAKDIAKAKKKLADGDHDALKKKYEGAIEDYEEAWQVFNKKDD